jgi:predicted DNA-binding transcriptional regulator AlpA
VAGWLAERLAIADKPKFENPKLSLVGNDRRVCIRMAPLRAHMSASLNGQGPMTDTALSVPQFARKYGVGESTVWSWIAQGFLVSTKLGPQVTRILPEQELAWLSRAKQSQPKNPKAA